MQNDLNNLVQILSTLRIPPVETEYQLHTLIAAALDNGGFCVSHEAKLGTRCRVDFMVGRIALEVKRGKPDKKRLIEQCGRYLAHPEVDALILVLDTNVTLPNSLNGKPLRVIGLNKLWGIALP